MPSEITERQDELLTNVFGENWKQCVSPKGREQLEQRLEDEEIVVLSAEAVDEVFEELEYAMSAGKMALSHEEVRPSAARLAHRARDAYRTLVDAHPGYELSEESEK